ncbi:MAG: LysO family transporter [candidate division WOR-3 bacterium]
MINIFIFFLTGIIIGFLLKKFNFLKKFSEIIIYILIAVFLFVIGYSVGSDEEILFNLNKNFYYSLIFSITGILGSSLLTYFLLKK